MSRFVSEPGDFRRSGEPRPILVTRDLLKVLGVLQRSRSDQQSAINEWLTSNTPNEILEFSLRRLGFLRDDESDDVPKEPQGSGLSTGRPRASQASAPYSVSSPVVIVGSGVVGTATGKGLSSAGHDVTFIDINPGRVADLRAEGYVASDRIELGDEPSFVFLVLPTPSGSGGYDLSYLTAGVSDVGAALGRSSGFHTVVLRSTTPPGTCDDVVRPILEGISGKLEGEGFALASVPEFLRGATALEDFMAPSMTVIGSRSTLTVQRLVELFRPFGGPVRTFSTTAEAELVKCAHNLFNAAKISFWNELWLVAERLGFNGDEVAATVAISSEGSTNPQYGIRGGAPYGGACLPKDTVGFLGFANELGIDMPLLSAVIEVNRTMAHRVRVELAEVTDHFEELLGPETEPLSAEQGTDR